ncbi:MAG: siderophore-interacting protein [Actinomycetota bacterium]|nr:siderophore-interacting protein [Actinomycetota bacterium]
MRTFRAKVLRTSRLSPHLVSVTLGGLTDYATTGIPDEYVRVLIAPPGEPLVLPEISDDWVVTFPEGAVQPAQRVYTISDYRVVDGIVELDLDVVVHVGGIGATWAQDCRPGDEVGLIEPHGLYAAPAGVGWQLLVSDLTGVPALARILRRLDEGQRAEATVVVTDAADEIPLPSPADVTVTWKVVAGENDITGALTEAVTGASLPESDRYVWLAGEARASRSVRRHLRRELGWPQSDFYTCGYWQIDAEKWNKRYEEVAEVVLTKAQEAEARAGEDEGAYLDALEDIYESVGL